MNPFRRQSDPFLGPNLATAPNGSFVSAPWTAENLTETTGQTDPFGGSTASLLTDTAVNTVHRFYFGGSPFGPLGTQFQATLYFKPGTYPNGITFCSGSRALVGVSNVGATSIVAPDVTGLSVVSVGGFFKVTLTYTPVAGDNFFLICFLNTGQNQAYLGTGQNQTFWGMSLRRLFYP